MKIYKYDKKTRELLETIEFVDGNKVFYKTEALEEAELRRKYQELILAVEFKYKDETRHQTALRILKQWNDTRKNDVTEEQGKTMGSY
jgi:hypothetical protein